MKLDNIELASQRTRILKEINELIEHIETLKDNLEFVFSFKEMEGIFFRIKDIVYCLLNEDSGLDAVAGTMDFDDLPSIIFKPLVNKRSIEYYNTDEGKLEALDTFEEYISNNVFVVLHELVHIDDKRNGIEKPDDKSVSNNPYAYYNHPAEIRAFTQQNLYIAQNEIYEAITSGEIKTKKELKDFCRIYRKYKDIFTKNKEHNNFVYWKPSVFKDYLNNLDFIIDLMSSLLPE